MLSTVNQQKLKWFGHVVRHDTLPKTILQGYVECGERRDKQKKTGLLMRRSGLAVHWGTSGEQKTGLAGMSLSLLRSIRSPLRLLT